MQNIFGELCDISVDKNIQILALAVKIIHNLGKFSS